MNALFHDTCPVTLNQQVEELRRELAQRKAVYPRLIEAKRLTPMLAERQNRSLEAAIATLESLRKTSDPGDA